MATIKSEIRWPNLGTLRHVVCGLVAVIRAPTQAVPVFLWAKMQSHGLRATCKCLRLMARAATFRKRYADFARDCIFHI
jgi:hypothetical protein